MCIHAFLTAIMSSLSILGCSVIFFTYAAYTDLRTPGRRLLVNLCVADMLTATGNNWGSSGAASEVPGAYYTALSPPSPALPLSSGMIVWLCSFMSAWFMGSLGERLDMPSSWDGLPGVFQVRADILQENKTSPLSFNDVSATLESGLDNISNEVLKNKDIDMCIWSLFSKCFEF